MARLRLDNLTKVYGSQPVLEAFSLTVKSGELCVILGPSGSGKTTVMNMIVGLTPPTSGEIFIDDMPITHLAPYERGVGMMFQGYALFPHMTVFENVAFPLRARGFSDRALRDRVQQTLKLVELEPLGERHPSELSGGQQQRVALARALVFEPRLLLMDEPLAALDKRLRDRMQTELRTIQKNLGITLLYITHDQQEAMTLADRIVVINKGRIEQIGPPLEVYHQPQTQFVCECLGESNFFEARVEEVDGDNILFRISAGVYTASSQNARHARGDRVTVAIRPEKLRRITDPDPKENIIRCRITNIVDVGVWRRYHVSVEGTELPLLFIEAGSTADSPCEIGNEVALAFNQTDAFLLTS